MIELDGSHYGILGSKIKIKLFIDERRILREEVLFNIDNEEPCNRCVPFQQPEHAPPLGIMEPGEEYIIVSKLPSTMLGAEIISFFEAHIGLVKSCGVFTTSSMNYDQCSGKAGITFRQPEDARFALIALEHSTLLGQPLEIELFIDKHGVYRDQLIFYPPESSNVNKKHHVYISDLPLSVSAPQIIEHFEQLVGPVESLGLELDEHGFYNGNAKLLFHNPSNARTALIHDNSIFYGNRIKMTFVNHCSQSLHYLTTTIRK